MCVLEADCDSNGEDDDHVHSISSTENKDPAADYDISDGGASSGNTAIAILCTGRMKMRIAMMGTSMEVRLTVMTMITRTTLTMMRVQMLMLLMALKVKPVMLRMMTMMMVTMMTNMT